VLHFRPGEGCLSSDENRQLSDIHRCWHYKKSYVTTDGHSTSLSWFQALIWGPITKLLLLSLVGLLMCCSLSEQRTGLYIKIASDPRQHSLSRVRRPRNLGPYFTVSDSRLLQLGGRGRRIYISQERQAPAVPPGTTF
jgi:hypothetical protein